jgi:hypothetical protein
MLTLFALIGLAGAVAAFIVVVDDWFKGDPQTVGYWTTNSDEYR